jgi:hypothetical protein
MRPELSVPVIWVEDGGTPQAGRLDLFNDRLHLDGGIRDEPRTRDVPLADVGSVRMGRANGDRINGRQSIVLALAGGATLSLAAFARPGTLLELAHRLEVLV